jgi:hypothetical protein
VAGSTAARQPARNRKVIQRQIDRSHLREARRIATERLRKRFATYYETYIAEALKELEEQ